MKKLISPKSIVTVDSKENIFNGYSVEVEDGIIKKIAPTSEFDLLKFDGEIIRCSGYTLIPGFVQTHLHLCQTLFRGLADDLELLDWLQKKIFPFENEHTADSLKLSTQLGLNELISSGTTAIVDMGTLRYQEVIFEELISTGIRGYSGNCMIDINELYPKFCISTADNLSMSRDYAKSFHNSSNGKIKYAFSPRFVLSCSERLLKETKEMMIDFDGSMLHTHSSENKKELEIVKQQHGLRNIEYFDSINLLNDKSILAHCVHVDESEINILKKKNVRVAHCPSSNLKLGSGIANIPLFIKEGISVSIGADGAPCNNSLSIFKEMHIAALIQKPSHGPTAMDAKTVFKLATIEGAKALYLENEIGSIEEGKKADFVLLDLEDAEQSLDENSIYSKIVYSADKNCVREVFIDGKRIVENGKCIFYDEEELLSVGKEKLVELLKRI
ncbi:MAG: amidohydrolase family protein [Ignavibacteria bacterium]|nr:amidohydrolase family protein [Ignavibacteria bacterium]